MRSANVAPLAFFTVDEWEQRQAWCIQEVLEVLGDVPMIVRSSCLSEDGYEQSNAGAYHSVLGVTSTSLPDAVDRVIASYGTPQKEDEILVQPMLQDVRRSGVGFSHDPNTCSPYRVINWSGGANTEQITGGKGGRVWQQAAFGSKLPNPECQPVVELLEELLILFEGTPIDCEFAFTVKKGGGEKLWLLQARPLILSSSAESDEEQSRRLQLIEEKIERGMNPHPFLVGKRTVYGIMPDWNPAEIIGVRPKPLSLSLYRELITDSIWAYQRHNYGYRNLRSFPLMPHFFGLPYVDVRISFNSFIPAELDENLANQLVDHYIELLLSKPNLHDKVEFEIVFSCYTLDLPQRLDRLDDAGFSKSEKETIADSLRALTNRIVDSKNGIWRKDEQKLQTLKDRRDQLLESKSDPVERIYWLLEDCKRYGTLPFAGLARAGFLAVQMLNSLASVGVLSITERDSFMCSLSTVSGQLTRDRATLDKTTFLSRYGHLRPGTYDLTSPRYDESPDLYFDWSSHPTPQDKSEQPFALSIKQLREIGKLLDEHRLKTDAVGLFDFMQAGIESRESAKFHFTRNLSDALSLVGEIGERNGITKEDLAYCNIGVFKEIHISATDVKDSLLRSIEAGKELHANASRLSLPPLISNPEEVWGFEWPQSSPNFITQNQATAKIANSEKKDGLSGAIVCIPNADPGFDWLFSRSIAGLVTAWGGVNSHMAIRAGELGLPAAIGVGEVMFKKVSSANRVLLDCKGRRIEVLG